MFLFVFLFGAVYAASQEQCQGVSDILFVVDASGSISYTEWRTFLDFVYAIVSNTTNVADNGIRFGFVQFGGVLPGIATALFNFTANVSYIKERLDSVRTTGKIGGSTPYLAAFNMANQTFLQNSRSGVQKFILFFSDGAPSDETNITKIQIISQKFFSQGIVMSGVLMAGTGSTEAYTIRDGVSAQQCLYNYVPSITAAALKPIIDFVKIVTCVDLYSIVPSYGCYRNASTVTFKGAGFLNRVVHPPSCTGFGVPCVDTCSIPVYCRVLSSSGSSTSVATVSDLNTLSCPIPSWLPLRDTIPAYVAQVSIDKGITWTTSAPPFLVMNCSSTDYNIAPLTTQCRGVSDIVLVLDSSFSINDSSWSALRAFVANLTGSIYIDPAFTKVSMVQFTTDCDAPGQNSYTMFNLSGTRRDIIMTSRTLARCGRGQTPMHAGLKAAYNQLIDNGRTDASKFIVVVTDGSTDSCFGRISNPSDCFSTKNVTNDAICPIIYNQLHPWCADTAKQNLTCYSARIGTPCCSCDLGWVERIRAAGISLYTVGVGSGDADYMKTYLSTFPSYAAYVDSYENLPSIVGNILSTTCIVLVSLELSTFCGENGVKTNAYGSGFVGGETYYRVVKKDGFVVVDRDPLPVFDTWSGEVNLPARMMSDGTYSLYVTVGSSGVWTAPLEFSYSAKCQASIEVPKIWPYPYIGLLIMLIILLGLALALLFSMILIGMKKKPQKVQKIELKVEEVAEPEALPEPIPEPEPVPESVQAPADTKRSQYFFSGRVVTGLLLLGCY